MPELKVLIGLLEEISKGTPEGVDDRLKFVKDLLRKVSESEVPVHIDIDYDGKKFYWKIPCANITASEWTPRHLRPKEN